MSSSPPMTLIHANLMLLRQAQRLLEGMSDSVYGEEPGERAAPVGGHLRHVLEHYSEFLRGLNGEQPERIDYSARQRDAAVERVRSAALARVTDLVAAFEDLAGQEDFDLDRPITVRDDDGEDEAAGGWALSTLRREFQFLQSHTVHHYALIVLGLKLGGHDREMEFAEGFGVAPSTLRHRDRQRQRSQAAAGGADTAPSAAANTAT